MKDNNEVIKEFNEIVNMTASELEKWLKSDDATSSGWSKDDGSGESVGHDSGRNIVEILKANPDKKEDKYDEDQIAHMRKEEKMIQSKSEDEVRDSKSYKSLKNWGHDPLKNASGMGGSKGEEKQTGDKRKADDKADAEEEEEEEEKKGEKEEDEPATKKQETSKGKSEANGKAEESGKKEDNKVNGNDEKDEREDKSEKKGDKPEKGPEPGDTVSWNWGNGQPEGKVLDVKGEKTSVKTKRGNEVTRDGNPEDPAVVLDTGKSKAIKSNHELN